MNLVGTTKELGQVVSLSKHPIGKTSAMQNSSCGVPKVSAGHPALRMEVPTHMARQAGAVDGRLSKTTAS